MKISLLIFFLANFNEGQQTKDEYVCLPCGYSCDDKIHAGPGTCETCGMALVKKSNIKFNNITLDELCQRIQTNPKAVLLDVRSQGEFEGTAKEVPSFGHFKKAINVNVEELEMRLGELSKYKDQEILVYCSHNHRSPRASYLLSTNGFANVKNMTGGVSTFQTQTSLECLKKEFVFHPY